MKNGIVGRGLILCQRCHINKLHLRCKEVILLTARLAPEARLCHSCNVLSGSYIIISNLRFCSKKLAEPSAADESNRATPPQSPPVTQPMMPTQQKWSFPHRELAEGTRKRSFFLRYQLLENKQLLKESLQGFLLLGDRKLLNDL